MKKLLIILLLGLLSGCSYMVPSSTNIEPAATELNEKRVKVEPPEQKEFIEERIRITRGRKENK